MSILGITLGVTVLITVQSVMNGFASQYETVFITTQGHLNIYGDGPIKNPEEVAQLARSVPGVNLAEPVIYSNVILSCNGVQAFPLVRSFDVSTPGAPRNPLADKLVAGSIDDLDDQHILLGQGLADQLDAHLGDKVEVYSPHMLDEIKRDSFPMPRALTVAGVFNTGFALYDENTAAVTLRLLRELNGLTDEAGNVEVRLDNDDVGHMLDVEKALQQKLAVLNQKRAAAGDHVTLTVSTWQEMNAAQLQIIFVEKSVMFYIMIVIVIVAAFCILCSLATSVVRKTREIGVLGALGARPVQIAAVFCLQGLVIGLVGAVLGVGLSLFLLHFREPIVETVVDQRLIEKFYNFYQFPVQYRTLDFVQIIGFTFVISTLAGVLPACWAARLKPAECLRYE
jgi:lipoprotein-releasing system permease protein